MCTFSNRSYRKYHHDYLRFGGYDIVGAVGLGRESVEAVLNYSLDLYIFLGIFFSLGLLLRLLEVKLTQV